MCQYHTILAFASIAPCCSTALLRGFHCQMIFLFEGNYHAEVRRRTCKAMRNTRRMPPVFQRHSACRSELQQADWRCSKRARPDPLCSSQQLLPVTLATCTTSSCRPYHGFLIVEGPPGAAVPHRRELLSENFLSATGSIQVQLRIEISKVLGSARIS